MKTEQRISLICALGTNRAIGRGNELLWRISEDLKRFKRITTGHAIIMGRKTYESIGRPLPNRTNIIITRNESYKADGCVVVHSLDGALDVAIDCPFGSASAVAKRLWRDRQGSVKDAADEVFIIGGGEIYNLAIGMADRLYLTLVDDAPEDADTFFPDYSKFSRVIEKKSSKNDDLLYDFIILER